MICSLHCMLAAVVFYHTVYDAVPFVTIPQMSTQRHILGRKEGGIPPLLLAFRHLKGYVTANQVFITVK